MHDEHYFASRYTDRSQLTVARTLPVPFAAAIAAAVTLTRPPLVLGRRWQRDTTGPFDRSDLAPARAPGRLLAGRRVVPVEVELAPWSESMCELLIRPDVRAPHRWSGRRRRNWYASAHSAADALRQQLLAAQPAVYRPRRTGPPTTRRRLAG
ncbi:MAG: hypothetical protein ACRDV7_06940 [Acidimicrobiia bacterium]